MQHQDIKELICASTIQQDQERVSLQWANTFYYNRDDAATNMARMLVACVAKGDFKTKNQFAAEFEVPSRHLTIADYVSHASRIIIDYQGLSAEHQSELLKCFDVKAGYRRAATHDVKRNADKLVEGKGMVIGGKGAVGYTTNDFGINIAMGGIGQQDFCGQSINTSGHSGHFYYHVNTKDNALLCGLEQSGPAVSWLEVFTHIMVGAHPDQFGQTHSLGGLPDIYTAAGSLYFSDPIYQANLMLDKGVLPPAKYNGMLVKLTDDNWLAVKEFDQQLQQKNSVESLNQLLLTQPAITADTHIVESYIELDFKNYFEHTYKIWIKDNVALDKSTKEKVLAWQTEILKIIEDSNVSSKIKLDLLNREFLKKPDLYSALNRYSNYFVVMNRVLQLFINHCQQMMEKDVALIHGQHLSQLYDTLQEELRQLLNDAHAIQGFYTSEQVDAQDRRVNDYLSVLQDNINALEKNIDNINNDLMSSSITDSFVLVPDKVTDDRIRELDALANNTRTFLRNYLKLGAKTDRTELQVEKNKNLALNVAIQDANAQIENFHEIEQRLLNINSINNNDLLFAQEELARFNQDNQKLKAEVIQLSALNIAEQDRQVNLGRIRNPISTTAIRFKNAMPIIEAISALVELSASLHKSGHTVAAKQAIALANDLGECTRQYIDHREDNKYPLTQFKEACKIALGKQRNELYEQAIGRQIRNNVLLALGLLGVGYLIAIGFNKVITGNLMFFNGTSRKAIGKSANNIIDENQAPSVRFD
jgi:hypothetical protein